MSAPKVILILGSGPNIGASTATLFSSKGYKVATVSCGPHSPSHGPTDLHLQRDLSDPSTIPSLFTTITTTLGAPSTILYNAAALTLVPPSDPLSLPLTALQTALNTTTLSSYAAAHSAIQSLLLHPRHHPQNTHQYRKHPQPPPGARVPLVGTGESGDSAFHAGCG